MTRSPASGGKARHTPAGDKDGAPPEELYWHELPDAFLSEQGTVHLKAPLDADLSELQRQLRRGNYRHPFVFDDGETLRLHFNLRYVQSAMSIAEPDALQLMYTQKMTAFLLLRDPRHIVIVGLGGGSLTKFCYQRLPRARITTIEINQQIIGFGELFQVPPPNNRMRILHADAADYFAGTRERVDVVLLDGCDRHGVVPALCKPGFYRNLRKRLRPGGVLAVNLIGHAHDADQLQTMIAEEFGSPVMTLDVSDGGNRIVFVVNEAQASPDWDAIKLRAAELAQQHDLDFRAYARGLQRSYQRLALKRV